MKYLEMPIKAKPFEHQKRAFEFVMHRFENDGGAALLVEMGCGKSLISVAVAGALFNERRIRNLLIVCPLSICGVWEEEFSKFADFEYNLKVLKGSLEKKAEALCSLQGRALHIAVINYESAWRIERQIKNWHPDMIICDESHKIKSHNIAASKSLHKLGEKTRYKLILTGTAITNKAIDIFSQYKFLEPTIFGRSFYTFRNRYFDMVGYGLHTPVLKESMKDELRNKIHSIAFVAKKSECLDLPETTEIIRKIELEPYAMNTYKHLVRDSFAELQNSEVTVTNVLTKILRLSQLTGGFLGDDEGKKVHQISKAKLNALEDIIDDVTSSGKKLVIMARFIPEIDAIKKLLVKKNLSFSVITGDVKNRADEISKFQNDVDVLLFVGQIATAGLGITLTASSTMVFYSLDYSMSNFEQAKARIHRTGQRENCTYIYLIASNTVDEKILEALRNKVNLAKSLIDDYKNGLNPYANEGGF
ncbi:MAG: DEAD/DEAH box helicase [Phascolarctobacterium sp.]|nr:DEAD/DEAH box helicase [Phascolarctobacterium sp.]